MRSVICVLGPDESCLMPEICALLSETGQGRTSEIGMQKSDSAEAVSIAEKADEARSTVRSIAILVLPVAERFFPAFHCLGDLRANVSAVDCAVTSNCPFGVFSHVHADNQL